MSGNPANATINSENLASELSIKGFYQFIYSINNCSDTITILVKEPANAGNDQFFFAGPGNIQLSGSPVGGNWSFGPYNLNSCAPDINGLVQNLSIAGKYEFTNMMVSAILFP